jgi:hypothetical protein
VRHLKNVRAAWKSSSAPSPERYQDESPHHGLQIAGTGLLLLARINRVYQEHLAKLGKRRRDRQRKALLVGNQSGRSRLVSWVCQPERPPVRPASRL